MSSFVGAEATTWLVGDIGATHARFGLVSPSGQLMHSRSLSDENYPTIDAALDAFLAERGPVPMPVRGAIAIASPISGDRVAMTNHPWTFSILELKNRVGFDRLEANCIVPSEKVKAQQKGPWEAGRDFGGAVALPHLLPVSSFWQPEPARIRCDSRNVVAEEAPQNGRARARKESRS